MLIKFLNRIKSYFIRFILNKAKENLLYYSCVRPRLNYCKVALKKKENRMKILSSSQEKEIKEFWNKYNIGEKQFPFDKLDYCVYNSIWEEERNICKFIPYDFWHCYIDPYLSNPVETIKYDDKNFYDLYFKGVSLPITLVRKIDQNIYLDSSYLQIKEADVVEICKKEEEVILKMSINSDGGKGVYFWNNWMGEVELKKILKSSNSYVIQRIVKQHQSLSNLNKSSLNTIRVMTLFYNGEPLVLSSVMRMGSVGMRVDNISSGGLFCGIGLDGKLKNIAYDSYLNIYKKHPNGFDFSNVIIPNFVDIQEKSKMLSLRFEAKTKLISWDWAISEDGTPILIEANLTGGQMDIHQICNGPILGDITEEFLYTIFSDKNFKYHY